MSKARISVRAAPPSKVEGPKLSVCTLALGQQQHPLFSGSVQYFRIMRTAWRPALEALKSLGLNIVETSVPWSVHELRDGTYDFGQYDPQKDLGAFLDLAHSLGLLVFVRPGPCINAELTYFGLPRRIVFDEAYQAKSPRGRPLPFVAPPRMFPLPSFASERFFHEVESWFAVIGRVVEPRVWPRGPVVMAEVDSGAPFYLRDAPYDQDHHPDALTKYRAFLHSRYATLPALNQAHNTDYARWEDVLPATGCRPEAEHPELRRSLDLMQFQQELLAEASARMQSALHAHIGVLPTVHNAALIDSSIATGLSEPDASGDVHGVDYAHGRGSLSKVKARTLHLAGSVRLPYAPHMALGAPPWSVVRSPADSLQTWLCACAYGLRGLNLYMVVDRDRWYGAPFDEFGRERPHAKDVRNVVHALNRTHFHALRRRVTVGIMLPKEYARLTRATHTLGALSPALLARAGAGAHAACLNSRFGFETPIQLAWVEFVTQFARALDHQRVPYVLLDSDAPSAQLDRLRAVIAPMFEFADPKRIERLVHFAQRGGRVFYGPRSPRLDEALHALPFDALQDSAELRRCDGVDAEPIALELADKFGTLRTFGDLPPSVDLTLHEDDHGPRVLFLIQSAATDAKVELHLPKPLTLRDAVTHERYTCDADRRIQITAPAYTCRMLICDRSAAKPKSRTPSARRNLPPC